MEICEKNDVGPVVGSKSTDLQSLCSSDLTSEESTAISICHIKEPQTLMKLNEGSQENAGDAERVAVGGETDLHLEIKAQIKTSDSTSEAEASEENICEASVLFKEVEFIGDTVTVESNITTESDFLQSSPDSLKVSQNSVKEVSGETDTILKQSHINIIPEDSHREEAHSKSSPVIHKRKMGSTRRPLKGNKGQRKEKEHHDENESLECEGIISVEKKTFSLEDESSTNASPLRTTKDGVKQQEMELCEENDVGPVEGSESALLQSSCSSDLLSEDSTTVSICHVTELQTLMKLNEESQENAGDAEKLATEEDKDLQLKNESQNKMFDSTTSEAEGKEENISDVSVTLLREVEVNRDTGTVESNMTTESDFLQTSPDAHIEALKISEIAEKVPGETDTILKQSDISIIPQDSHREEAHSKSSPVIHKRKMGSTRRPLKGNKGQREEHDEKEIFSLEDEPSPDESRHTAVNVCDISESQTFSKIHAGSQENTGDVEIVPADGDTERHLENKTFESTAFGGEATEENICEASVLVKEVEFIGDTVTVDSNMTTESDLIQNDTSSDAKLEALKVSDNAEREVQKETDEVPKQSDTTIIPEDTQREEAHSEFTVIHKRKMGSTRRPLRGKNAQRKEKEHLDENETPDSEGIINVEEETIRLENEPSLDESTLQSLKVGVKEQEIEICEKNDVGPVEGSESALLQSSCSSDLLSEESIAVSICHVTESQTLMKPNEVSRENAGVAEKLAAEEDKDLQLKTESQNKMFDSTTSEAEGTEENISDVSVTLLREVEVNRDTGTVESNMTTESDFLQTSPDAHIEALKISENAEKEVPGETDTILKQSDISIIPDDSHREDAHSKSSPVIHKRKMGSTRRPLKGNKGQKPEHDEKEIFSLEDESSPDESRHTADHKPSNLKNSCRAQENYWRCEICHNEDLRTTT
ncbi:hypothetical protein cypCar_00030806 [Cyprinus carpio]|nr:hypothetical protein cypCar_00030806 [Cyprinus carpio]